MLLYPMEEQYLPILDIVDSHGADLRIVALNSE